MSRVDDAGILRLPCVIHTCGITRRQVPSSEFLTFYWGQDNGRALIRRERTIIDLGLVVWLSFPRFGPREWWSEVPISVTFHLGGHLANIFGYWLGMMGYVTVGVRYVGDRARRVETRVLQTRLRVWGVRGVLPGDTPEVFSESKWRNHCVDFGEIVLFIRWFQEARDDVSITGLNLFVLRFLPPAPQRHRSRSQT